jgi:Sec-independent protein secretion pathway component TatC
MQAYFALAVGTLIILGNLRDLLPGTMPGPSSALMNVLLGVSLVLFFIGSAFGWFWYVPALALALAGIPLAVRRSAVYTAYIGAGRTVVDGVRRVVGSRTRIP